MSYRIASTGGTVTTKFAGRPDPFCVPFDACGASGTLTDAVSGLSTLLEFDAQRVVKRRASRRAALADLRSGRLPLQDTGSLLIDVLSADVGWSAGSTCTDRLKQFNSLGVGVTEQPTAPECAVRPSHRPNRGPVAHGLPRARCGGRARVFGCAGADDAAVERAGTPKPADRHLRTRTVRVRQLSGLSQRRRHVRAATDPGARRDQDRERVPGRAVRAPARHRSDCDRRIRRLQRSNGAGR